MKINENLINANKEYCLQKIVSNCTVEDFNDAKSVVEELSSCLAIHDQNVNKMKIYQNYYLGEHDIKTKKRVDNSEINNIEKENHIYNIVEFKKGFMVGKPIDYSLNSVNEADDDITILSKHIKSANKSSLDIDKYEDIYLYGIAHQMIVEREIDEDDDTPFSIINLNNKNTFCVYSNDSTNEMLYAVCIIKSKENKLEYKIYTKEKVFTIFKDEKQKYILNEKSLKFHSLYKSKIIPIVEFTLNKNRMGIVSIAKGSQDLINKIISNQMDDLEGSVNNWLVFVNQKIDQTFIDAVKEMKKERIITVYSKDEKNPASVSTLDTSINHDGVNVFFDKIVKTLYDITATPISSGNVTSGGDTGQARLLGNGWESAQNRAEVDTSYIIKFERKILKLILLLEKKQSVSENKKKIEKLKSIDIEIKYNINMSNNLQVKTQAYMNLNNAGWGASEILQVVNLTNDIDGFAKKIEENKEKQLELEASYVTKETTDNIDNQTKEANATNNLE